MYSIDYVENSDNSNNKILLLILLIVISGAIGVLYYFFVFKCNSKDDECTSTSDCCEGLECVDSKCSSSTPTVSPQPFVVVNNVEPEPEPEPEPESTTCSDWDIDYDCPDNTTPTPGDVIGSSEDDCCRSLTCGDWDLNNDCATDTTLTPGTVIGSSEDDCCRPLTCGDWNGAGNTCQSVTRKYDDTKDTDFGYSDSACCIQKTCNDFLIDTGCGEGEILNSLNAQEPYYTTDYCCVPAVAGDDWFWDEDSAGRSCDEVCENNQMTCEDGYWGVHDKTSFKEVFGTSMSSSFCPLGRYEESGGGVSPYVTTSGICRYRNMNEGSNRSSGPGESICGNSNSNYRRLCKCVPPHPP